MREQKRIGEILREQGVVDAEALDKALEAQAGAGQRICSYLFLNETASEDALVGCLSTQLGVPGVALNRSSIDLAVFELIPHSVAERYSLLPMAKSEDRLSVAMADPSRKDVIEEVQFVTGTRVDAYVALKGIVDAGLRSAYEAFGAGRRDLVHGPGVEVQGDQAVIAAVHQQAEEIPAVVGELADAEGFTLDETVLSEVEQQMGDVPSAPAPEPARTKRARVLVVDDEENIRGLLKTALDKEGYEVLLAERGLEALQMVKGAAPDLVLLDAMLPEIHGFEICKKIKTSKRFSHVAVIMVTAVYRGWRFALDVKATYGADDYIEKPFSVAEVLRRVEEQLVAAQKLQAAPQADQVEIENLRRRGSQAHRDGEYEQALESFRLAVEMDPFDSRLHFMLAMCLQALEQSFPAIYEFERAVELEADLFPALKNLAVLYERGGFRNKATEMWERALRFAPKPDVKETIRAHLLELLA